MTEKNYDNIDFLLNIYNDLIYHKTPEKSYRFDPISRKSIQLSDLKKSQSFDYSHVLDGELKYLGMYNNRLHFKRKSKTGYPCHVMFGCYDDSNTTNIQKGVLYNVAIMYMASEFVVNEKFKHSILPVMFFDVEKKDLVKKIPDIDKIITESKIPYKEGSQWYCLVTEHFFNMVPLSEFLKMHTDMNETLWKVLFFQVLYSLYKLTERLSQFRHNRLNLDAIMVYVKNIDSTKTLYKVGDTKFLVPNAGFDIKIGDYDYASTPDYLPNAVTGKNPYNDYFDVNYFFSYLSLWIKENNINLPKSVIGFISDVAPESLIDKNVKTTSDFTGLDESIDIKNMNSSKTIPSMILKKNNFFGVFNEKSEDNKNMDMSATPIENPTANIAELGISHSGGSDFSESEYIRSVTDSDSENPRLLGKLVNGNTHGVTHQKKNQKTTLEHSIKTKHIKKPLNKNLDVSNNTMPRKTNKQSGIRKKSEISSDSENGYTESDILENADRFYKSRSKNTHQKTSKTVNDDSTNSTDAYEGAVLANVTKKTGSKKSANKNEDEEYNSYFNKLRDVARPKTSSTRSKKMFDDVPDLSNSDNDSDSDDRSKNASDTVSISSDSSSEYTGTANYKKFMDALDKVNMASILAKMSSESDTNKNEENGKRSSKHRKHEDDHDTTSQSQEGGDSEEDEPRNRRSNRSRSSRSQKNQQGYEAYLGNKLAKKIKDLPDNYIAEVPPHLAHMLPDENGVVFNPNDMMQNESQKPNAMAGLLGFGGEGGMGGMAGMGSMEPPQGIHSNRSAPGFGSMKPSGQMSGMMQPPMETSMMGMPQDHMMPQMMPGMMPSQMPSMMQSQMPSQIPSMMSGQMQGMPQMMPGAQGMYPMDGMADPSMMGQMMPNMGDMNMPQGFGGFPMMGGAKPKRYRLLKDSPVDRTSNGDNSKKTYTDSKREQESSDESKTQVGGADRGGKVDGDEKKADPKFNIPEFKEPTNNPMIPNEQKRIFTENRPYKDTAQQGNPILNLQLYQPPKPKPDTRRAPNPAVFYPNYVPNPFDPISYANYMQMAGYNMQPTPIYKEYNINIGGVSGSHIKTAMFFEDALPVKNVSGSFRSIGERQTMYESIRANLFTQGDGKDVPIENDTYNLLSHIKLMDMNPYNASRFSRNPYKGLPFGFLLYRSCYPMRHDMRQFDAVCASNSTGVNVRIYRLTEGAYTVNKQDVTKASDYDEWRDMAFYNFIKEQILKKKICPNFPFMYGYNISLNSGINFDDLKLIQDPDKGRTTDVALFNKTWGTSNVVNNPGSLTQGTAQNTLDALRRMNNRDRALPVNTMVPATGSNVNPGMVKQVIGVVRDPKTGLVTREITNMPSREEQAIMLNRYSGKALVCLTEACNYSLIGWAKKEYRADGNIKTMINSGYHTRAVWESVIFQMLVALYVMQIKGLVINNFKIDRNVFIKDISTGGTVTNYWKFKIEGIEYYIPNYGYLVMIDSNFRDFDHPCSDDVATDPNRTRKLDGSFLDYCKLSQDECIQKTFDMFKSAIDPNIFDQDFVNDNGVKPPEDILRLLTNMKNMADSKPSLSIAYYIRQFMTMFMNNRTGGPLTETEINHVKRGAVKEFRKGQIVVMTDHDGVDKFVIVVRQKADITRIITKDKLDPHTANFIEKDVPTSSLNEYSVVEPIKQNFKMNESNLSEDSLLETYTVE